MICSRLPYFLPRIRPDHLSECCPQNPDARLYHASVQHGFSLQLLAWAMQHEADPKTIRSYLDRFKSPDNVVNELQNSLEAAPGGPFVPILYFAVERNSPEIIRILCGVGAQLSQRIQPLGLDIVKLPLLAYAVLSAENDLSDTTDTFITLLAMGSDPSDIPRDMWQDYLKTPSKDTTGNTDHEVSGELWCTPKLREALCRNLNLMQRYVLWKADSTVKQTPRMRAIAILHNIAPLFETQYHIIGQRSATEQMLDCIMDYFMFGDASPLVLLLTGPSGHGKTELAQRMGELLSLDMHTVDGTEMEHGTDIFGPKKPYQGWQEGAPLNNFLWEKAGERAVVFLDEVDKTSVATRNAMLKVFEKGFYEDRRKGKHANCSKIIWILAANVGVQVIQKFWADHLQDRSEEQQKKISYTSFEKLLKDAVINTFGAPFTGRLLAIIPFMPFNSGEQAVTAYKFMRKVWSDARKPISLDSKHMPGHIFVDFQDDGKIASHISKGSYSPETGARTLECAVKRDIRGKLSRVFLRGEEVVKDEMNDRPLENYEVRVITEGDVEEISVVHQGNRQVQVRDSSSSEAVD